MSVSVSALSFALALIPPSNVGREMGVEASSPSVTRSAPGDRRGHFAGSPDGDSRRSRAVSPVLAMVLRGVMKLPIGKSFDSHVIIP